MCVGSLFVRNYVPSQLAVLKIIKLVKTMNEINHAEHQSNFSIYYKDINVGSNEDWVKHINCALSDVLSFDKFKMSPKMTAFLNYVVQETLSGKSERIKAYTVAVDALGKPTSFDPQCDSSVRVLANRLRTTLENYYAINPEQTIFIEMYTGSYVPHFIDRSGNKIKYDFENKTESADVLSQTPVTGVKPDMQRSGLSSCHLVLV